MTVIEGERAARGCVVLVMHTTSYNVEAFLRACENAGVQAVIASDRCHVLDGVWRWPAESLAVELREPGRAAAEIVEGLHSRGLPPALAVLPVGGEVAAVVAARAALLLGLGSNDPSAAEAAANKLLMRRLCADAADPLLRVPPFVAFPVDADAAAVVAAVDRSIGWPCVVKPLLLSGSRGVIRADDPKSLAVALSRVRRLLSDPALAHMGESDDAAASRGAARQVLVEAFVSGPEVAVEGLLTDGRLRTLAFFDKPDPLDGPFFEETLYVTPSRHPRMLQRDVEAAVSRAAAALGLVTGPVHAEVRLGSEGPVVIEVAARAIGGLCSRTLRFGTGLSLEDVLIRHALGNLDPLEGGATEAALTRQNEAAGVMMIPIPAAGVLKNVGGLPAARTVAGIEDLVISVRPGETLTPLPEGSSYLGFIFARGPAPDFVEQALRAAHGRLTFEVAPLLAVAP